MTKIFLFFYSFFLSCVDTILSFWPNKKLKMMYQGRKDTRDNVERFIESNPQPIWIHCASLGEFEQGRPLIEAIKQYNPDIPIILSFFSPSGYEIRKDYKFADLVVYLPVDSPNNARWMANKVKPKFFIFVKYEFWWNIINELVHSPTKTILISGIFREKDYFFYPLLSPLRNMLADFDKIFVQDTLSENILKAKNIKNVTTAGDTRMDRVIENAKNATLDSKWHQWSGHKKVFVYGSIWDSDMPIVVDSITYYSDSIHILVPHDISEKSIAMLSSKVKSPSSKWSDESLKYNIIWVDTIGWLNKLYKIADISYVGGGFNKGIHNILEPASYGIPVFFGPRHQRFSEAIELKKIGQGFAIREFDEMLNTIIQIDEIPYEIEKIKQNSKTYFNSNKGATAKIMEYLTASIEIN